MGATCCQGQGSRMFGGLPEYVYSTQVLGDGGGVGVYINLYADSSIVVHVSGLGLVNISTATVFPFGQGVTHTVTVVGDTHTTNSARGAEVPNAAHAYPRAQEAGVAIPKGLLTLFIRGPSWAGTPFNVEHGGENMATVRPGSYTALDGPWASGGTITYTLPMPLRLVKYPATAAAQIKDFAFVREPSGRFIAPQRGCLAARLWPYTADCVFWQDYLSNNSLHFVPALGSRCTPTRAQALVAPVSAAAVAAAARGANYSCATYRTRFNMTLAHTDGYSPGHFTQTSFATEAACVAACEADTTCLGLTWVARPAHPCTHYQTVDAQQFVALPGCHNWIKVERCHRANHASSHKSVGGGGTVADGCTWYVNGTTRHPVACAGGKMLGSGGGGSQSGCAAANGVQVDPCGATAKTYDVTNLTTGAPFTCAMLKMARNASRYALLHGPLLMASMGPWDANINCVRLPPHLDTGNPAAWLRVANASTDLWALRSDIVGGASYTFLPYMLVQHQRFTTYPVIDP